MKQQVKKILQDLKDWKIAVSKIESDLKISSGYLWKVKEGIKNLSDDKFEELKKYHAKITGTIFIPTRKKVKTYNHVEEIVKQVNKPVMPKGLSLSQQLEWREKNA